MGYTCYCFICLILPTDLIYVHLRTCSLSKINLLNAELNPICHLLVLLGYLTLMGLCIVSIFQYISNKMQRYTVYLYLETALHVSGDNSTHHQERIQLYLQYLVFVTQRYCYLPLSWKSWNRFECAVELFHDSGG
jgi:hypothetical protein